MALPPQIEVPEAIRCARSLSIFSSFASSQPRQSVEAMVKMVSPKASFPVCRVSAIYIPKPNPTTEIFSKYFVAFWQVPGKAVLKKG